MVIIILVYVRWQHNQSQRRENMAYSKIHNKQKHKNNPTQTNWSSQEQYAKHAKIKPKPKSSVRTARNSSKEDQNLQSQCVCFY